MIISQLDKNYDFPISKKPLEYSIVLYWAINRFRLHNIDYTFTKQSFYKHINKYKKVVLTSIGTDWKSHKKYVDWYLNTQHEFINSHAKYSFNCLCSLFSVNLFFSELIYGQNKIILTNDDRKNYNVESLF